jgi:hypothetical protein
MSLNVVGLRFRIGYRMMIKRGQRRSHFKDHARAPNYSSCKQGTTPCFPQKSALESIESITELKNAEEVERGFGYSIKKIQKVM